MSVITDRIRERTEELGLRAIDIAAACRVSENTADRWMNGANDPRIEHIVPLARVLEVNPIWLIGEDVPPDANLILRLRRVAMESGWSPQNREWPAPKPERAEGNGLSSDG
jgi:transcriptional regulator with XRE-family HTH domain